jgi:MraZ protein
MLRGNSPAKIDDKGRLKIPTSFRKYIEEQYGKECFVTSFTGESVRIYPMPVWLTLESKLTSLPSTDPTIARFRNFANYYGQVTTMDDQGRLLIHPLLRDSSAIRGEVAVLGCQTWLDIWDHERFQSLLKANPLTDEHWKTLASLGI